MSSKITAVFEELENVNKVEMIMINTNRAVVIFQNHLAVREIVCHASDERTH
jgi:hypothetical protein